MNKKFDININVAQKLDDIKSKDNMISPCEKVTKDLIKLMQTVVGLEMKQEEFENQFESIVDTLYRDRLRILYHLITKESLVNLDFIKEQIEGNITIIYALINYEKEKNPNKEESLSKIKIMLKIYDHFSLLVVQSRDLNLAVKDMKDLTRETKKELEKLYSDGIEEVNEEIKNTKFDQISILGIFTGVAFIMFGGISMAGSLGQFTSKPSNLKGILLGIIIIGLILLNSVILLMEYIRSITNKEHQLMNIFIQTNPNYRLGPLTVVNIIVFLLLILVNRCF